MKRKEAAGEEFDRKQLAYMVAERVCRKGHSANKIAREIFPDEYNKKETQARAIMRVKRALELAVREKILVFDPPLDDGLARKLADRYPNVLRFTVVRDDLDPTDPAGAVFLMAAREVAKEIFALAEKSREAKKRKEAEEEETKKKAKKKTKKKETKKKAKKKKETKKKKNDKDERNAGNPGEGTEEPKVTIANAGGLTLSRVFEHLRTEAIVPDNGDSLRFLSLNAACKAENYQLSANYLAVQMAQIYGGRHIAVVHGASSIEEEYNQAIHEIDLLISSTGTRNSFLFLWHKEQYKGKDTDIPAGVVGDICFALINERGEKMKLSKEYAAHVEETIRPRPEYSDLQSLAANGRVLVVSTLLPDDVDPDADYSPSARAIVLRAVLKRGLASYCIVGTSVAKELFKLIGTQDG